MIYDDRLEDLADNILSIAIYDLLPSLDGNKVKNRLLDGTMHIQSIGEPIKYVNFKCVSDSISMNQINEMEFIGHPVKVFFDDKFYVGTIDSLGNWQVELFGEVDTRLYSTTITVAVSGEGVI